MENSEKKSSSRIVPIASLIKRHNYQDNKWKAYALSGQASAWFEKITQVQLSSQSEPVSVKVEVPLSHTAEFFIHFPEDFKPKEKTEVLVSRDLFPPLKLGEFYLCDVLGEVAGSSLGPFKILSYFETGDTRDGFNLITLNLESVKDFGGSPLKLEVPLACLRRAENAWFLADLEIWVEALTTPDEKD